MYTRGLMDGGSFAVVLCWTAVLHSFALPGQPFPVQAAVGTRRRSTQEDIQEHESIVFPKILSRSKDGSDMVVFLSNGSRSFTIQLERNDGLLSSNFVSKHYGKETADKGQANCFYHGTVVGHEGWTAAVGTCQGLRGFFGKLNDRKQQYHLEPLSTVDSSMEQPHLLYFTSASQGREITCGTKDHHHRYTRASPLNRDSGSAIPHYAWSSRQPLLVEWILVNDHRQYINHNRNITETVLRAIEIANFVDMVYRELDIRVVLVDVITWTVEDKIAAVTEPNTLLDNFRQYRSTIHTPHDSIMLITGVDLDGPTAGLAFKSTMCDDQSSVGLVQDKSNDVESVGSIAAHELGHILNMDHDGENCSCTGPTCIMAAVSSVPPPTAWSSCSKQELEQGFYLYNLGWCLTNEPNIATGHPMCGNGIREGDEACDCGDQEECTNPCCNALTCQLAEDAECSSGGCCTPDCHFRAYGAPCREASNECDLMEYCSGNSPACPADVSFHDGTPCDRGEAYCFSGSCKTHNEQCLAAFGEDSGKGRDICYTNWNPRGDEFGNCGYAAANYLPCDQNDVFCGQLHCIPSGFQLDFDFPVVVLSTTTTLLNGTNVQCSSFTSDPSVDSMSPGLVEDGTKCGHERICFTQKCIPLSQLHTRSCTVGKNGAICSGNGQCNSRGKCTCSVGYLGDACGTAVRVQDVCSGSKLEPIITISTILIALCTSFQLR